MDDDSDDRELFAEALSSVDSQAIYYKANDGQTAVEKLRHIQRHDT